MKTWISMLALVVFGCSNDESGSKVLLQWEGESIECNEGTGSGDAPGPDDTTASCDQTYSECSDGNEYRVVCDSVLGSETSTCDCYVGDEKVATAIPIDDECPIEDARARAACQWD